MKKCKRVLCLALCMIFCVSMYTSFHASAEINVPIGGSYTEGDFVFSCYDDFARVKEYIGTETHIVIPSKVENLKVTGIAPDAFKNCPEGISLVIPAGVEYFSANVKLCTLKKASKIEFLGNNAEVLPETFNIDLLKTVPENVDEYGNVYAGTYLVQVSAVDGICRVREGTTVVAESITAPTGIKEIYFPKSLALIRPNAFVSVPTLEKVHFDDSTVEIGESAFKNCGKLKDVYFGPNTKRVGSYAFNQYIISRKSEGMVYADSVLLRVFSNKKEYKIKKGTTLVADRAFCGLTHEPFCVTVPASVKRIGEYAFLDSYLAKIDFDGSMESIGEGVFRHCSELVSLKLPEGIKTLPMYFVRSSDNLRYIEIPASVKTIKRRAFMYMQPRVLIYHGTKEQYNKISISSSYNYTLDNASVICEFSSEGCPHIYTQNYTIHTTSEKVHYRVQVCMNCGKTIKLFNTSSWVSAAGKFRDVKSSDWFCNSVDFAYNFKVFSGASENTFEPAEPMTRAMFVATLMRLSGVKYSNKKATEFSDVPAGRYYSGAVRWASEVGIVSGVGKGRFAPDEPITREQLCRMIVLYSVYSDVDIYKGEDVYYFADDKKISKWAWPFVYMCQGSKLVSGKPGNLFDPQGKATRAEVARVLHSFHDIYLKADKK